MSVLLLNLEVNSGASAYVLVESRKQPLGIEELDP